MKNFKSRMDIGGSLGGFMKYDVSANFALQAGVDVLYSTSKLESKSNKSSSKYKSLIIELPLYGILQKEIGIGRAFLGAGPYIGYAISTKASGIDQFKKNTATGKATMNRFEYGLGGIFGYAFNDHWQINANYRFGLADLRKDDGSSMKTHGASVGVAYSF